jgi:hypothetical protein
MLSSDVRSMDWTPPDDDLHVDISSKHQVMDKTGHRTCSRRVGAPALLMSTFSLSCLFRKALANLRTEASELRSISISSSAPAFSNLLFVSRTSFTTASPFCKFLQTAPGRQGALFVYVYVDVGDVCLPSETPHTQRSDVRAGGIDVLKSLGSIVQQYSCWNSACNQSGSEAFRNVLPDGHHDRRARSVQRPSRFHTNARRSTRHDKHTAAELSHESLVLDYLQRSRPSIPGPFGVSVDCSVLGHGGEWAQDSRNPTNHGTGVVYRYVTTEKALYSSRLQAGFWNLYLRTGQRAALQRCEVAVGLTRDRCQPDRGHGYDHQVRIQSITTSNLGCAKVYAFEKPRCTLVLTVRSHARR